MTFYHRLVEIHDFRFDTHTFYEVVAIDRLFSEHVRVRGYEKAGTQISRNVVGKIYVLYKLLLPVALPEYRVKISSEQRSFGNMPGFERGSRKARGFKRRERLYRKCLLKLVFIEVI